VLNNQFMAETECTQTRYGNPRCPCLACNGKQTLINADAVDSMSVPPPQAFGPTFLANGGDVCTNGAGIPMKKLSNPGTGAAMHADKHKLNAKRPSAIAKKFKAAGLDWQTDFALAIKANNRERVALWLRLLPYLVTHGGNLKVKKWKGKASRAAMVALEALERE
jgi:hypothetical protein